MATEYSIWCDSIKKHINFNSEMIGDIEMFDITTILSHFDQTNDDIVNWMSDHIDLLHMIDNIVTDDDVCDHNDILSVSEGTIIYIDQNWYVNINVLVEYLRSVNMAFAHEVLAQAMFNRDDDNDECDYSDYGDYSEEEYTEESDESTKGGRSI